MAEVNHATTSRRQRIVGWNAVKKGMSTFTAVGLFAFSDSRQIGRYFSNIVQPLFRTLITSPGVGRSDKYIGIGLPFRDQERFPGSVPVPDLHEELNLSPCPPISSALGREINPDTKSPDQKRRPTKRALLIGINYSDRGMCEEKEQLQGCINDVQNVQNYLTEVAGFSKENIVVLTDDTDKRATRQNIEDAMKWLVKDAKKGDSMFFHFSGHGSQAPDNDDDEDGGMDATLLPIDHKKNGVITDDELNLIMVRDLPAGSRLTVLLDACHSGTAVDLPIEYMSTNNNTELEFRNNWKTAASRGSKADVVSFSSCSDEQVCLDTDMAGLMTSVFLETLRQHPNGTYRELICAIGKSLTKGNFEQKPQLGMSRPIDVDSPSLI